MVYEALDKIGVSMHVTKSERLKDMGSMFREATPEEEAKERELIDDLYDQFLDIVAEGRHMEKAKVKELATGEIFTGRRSVEVGLADELGDLERAIDVAAEMANAPRKPVWMRPHRGLREVLNTMVAGSVASSLIYEVAAQVEERLASSRYNIQHRL
jgi:protease-4